MGEKTPDPLAKAETTTPDSPARRVEVDAFLAQVRSLGPRSDGARGRLIFALDATMSRQPTWDVACSLQADMFREAATTGGLDVQLVYYRGIGECRASGWVSSSDRLARLMGAIDCRGGHTQIAKVLSHVRQEKNAGPVHALVFVGDAMEESLDTLCARAGEIGLLGVPCFMFQEGQDGITEQAFREIARLTRGAYCRFAPGAAEELRDLLRAVATYAAGGLKALTAASAGSQASRLLLQQLRS